jgi:hypothetical protein
VYPVRTLDTINIIDVPDAYAIWRQAAGDVSAFRTNLASTAAGLTRVPAETAASIRASIASNMLPVGVSLATDYAPPTYHNSAGKADTTDTEITKQQQRGKNVTSTIRNTLAELSQFSSVSKDLPRNLSLSFSLPDSLMTLSVPKLSFNPFSAPKIETLAIFAHFNTILSILYFIDTMYRLWLSARVIRRHWGAGLIAIPPCDIRVSPGDAAADADADAGADADDAVYGVADDKECSKAQKDVERGGARDADSNGPVAAPQSASQSRPGAGAEAETADAPPPSLPRWARPARAARGAGSAPASASRRGPVTLTQALLKLSTSFPAHVLLMALFILFVCYSFVALYVPWYGSYVDNCVAHAPGSDGTFIGRNIRALGLNYASSAGNERQSSRIAQYNKATSSYCSDARSQSSLLLSTQSDEYNALAADRGDLLQEHANLIECVNITAMDSAFALACCSTSTPAGACPPSPLRCPVDAMGAAYPPLGALLPDVACVAPAAEWTIDSTAVFNCR